MSDYSLEELWIEIIFVTNEVGRNPKKLTEHMNISHSIMTAMNAHVWIVVSEDLRTRKRDLQNTKTLGRVTLITGEENVSA